MPGYLRPDVQMIFPGSQDPKYRREQNEEGEPGLYWVEFTFQSYPLLSSDADQASLRDKFIGDSLLVISDPLPTETDRKHIFTIQAERNNLEYYVYCNQRGRLSHINVHHQASSFDDAIQITRENIEPFLSG